MPQPDEPRQDTPATSHIPEAGELAPDFPLPSGDGATVHLADLRGAKVVLYFYPKDDTPGCTTEACGFRDAWQELEGEGAKVFGISRDGVKSHQKFANKHGLPFTLLSDPDGAVAQQYGVWVEKSMYGKQYRSQFSTSGFCRGWETAGALGRYAEIPPWSKQRIGLPPCAPAEQRGRGILGHSNHR
jgi:peroxiredoxin Q/BCP